MAIKLDRTKLVGDLAKNYRVVPHIDRAIGEGEFEWKAEFGPKAFDDAWHPSGDCTPSLHELYLKATGQLQERPISASLRKTFMVGHFWHAYLQWVVVEKLGWAPWDQIEWRGLDGWGEMGTKQVEIRHFDHIKDPVLWKPYHWATGSVDVVGTVPGLGETIIDFKTMSGFDFKQSKAPARYVDKWECQANIYMHWLKLEEAIFVGIQKDSPHDLKEFTFRYNEPLVEAIYNKWKLVGACIEEGVEPPADEDIVLPLQGPS